MKKIINGCGECPFLYSDYDDYTVGCSTIDICNLARYLSLPDEYIAVYNGHDSQANTPDWCPLKKEEYIFSFTKSEEEIIENFQEDFDKIQQEISKLEDAGLKLQKILKDLGNESN